MVSLVVIWSPLLSYGLPCCLMGSLVVLCFPCCLMVSLFVLWSPFLSYGLPCCLMGSLVVLWAPLLSYVSLVVLWSPFLSYGLPFCLMVSLFVLWAPLMFYGLPNGLIILPQLPCPDLPSLLPHFLSRPRKMPDVPLYRLLWKT